MSYMQKSIDELDVLDDFLMNAIAADSEVGEAFCREVLSVLLQREIGKVKVRTQFALPALQPEYRGIRMDVEVEEFADSKPTRLTNVYDMEPHLQNDLDLPRHNRFYQAKNDARHMNRGDNDFSRMPDLFVITILNFDPFGYDYMMYTIQNHCVEVDDLHYQDGLKFIYFYTGGMKGGNSRIRNTLRYLQHSTADNATDDTTRTLHDYVSRVKVLPEVRQGYMEFEEYLYYQKRAAVKEARIEDILEILEEYGDVPEGLRKKLEGIKDLELLKKYDRIAAKSGSLEEFLEKSEINDLK